MPWKGAGSTPKMGQNWVKNAIFWKWSWAIWEAQKSVFSLFWAQDRALWPMENPKMPWKWATMGQKQVKFCVPFGTEGWVILAVFCRLCASFIVPFALSDWTWSTGVLLTELPSHSRHV
jgi:hypothetical protein